MSDRARKQNGPISRTMQIVLAHFVVALGGFAQKSVSLAGRDLRGLSEPGFALRSLPAEGAYQDFDERRALRSRIAAAITTAVFHVHLATIGRRSPRIATSVERKSRL
jgi:hypothetical protein